MYRCRRFCSGIFLCSSEKMKERAKEKKKGRTNYETKSHDPSHDVMQVLCSCSLSVCHRFASCILFLFSQEMMQKGQRRRKEGEKE
jgi:hypothetical protein